MVFKIGYCGDEVKQIQLALGLKADGVFGKKTENAVIEFQKENGLDKRSRIIVSLTSYPARIDTV